MTLENAKKADQLVARQKEVASRDGSGGTRGIRITTDKNGNHRFQDSEGKRIKEARALELIEQQLDKEQEGAKADQTQVQRTGFAWDRLNSNTQAFFQEICEQMLTATQDASLVVAVRLGTDIPKVSPQNQPRLTNLKKAGMLESIAGERKSHKMLRLTDAGRGQATALGLIS
ncbi:MAG: hypothetical protein VW076_00090 [Synechococcus sp.]